MRPSCNSTICRMISGESGKYGTRVTRPRKAGLNDLEQLRPQRLGQPRRIGRGVRVGAQPRDHVGADVRGQQDDGVLEVDLAALAVLHVPLVEDLEEDLLHAGMRLLHLVEQDDA